MFEATFVFCESHTRCCCTGTDQCIALHTGPILLMCITPSVHYHTLYTPSTSCMLIAEIWEDDDTYKKFQQMNIHSSGQMVRQAGNSRHPVQRSSSCFSFNPLYCVHTFFQCTEGFRSEHAGGAGRFWTEGRAPLLKGTGNALCPAPVLPRYRSHHEPEACPSPTQNGSVSCTVINTFQSKIGHCELNNGVPKVL